MSDGSRPLFIPISGIVLLTVSTSFTSLRLVAKCLRRGGRFDIGDFLLGLGWVCAVALTVIAIYASLTRNLSNHITHVIEVEEQVTAVFYAWLIEILYVAGLLCVKISLFYLYASLALDHGLQSIVSISRGFMGFLSLLAIAYTIIPFVACRPMEAVWRQVDPAWDVEFKCIDFLSGAMVFASLNAITDLAACVFPAWIVWCKKDICKAKSGLTFLMMAGLVAFVAGVQRTRSIADTLDENDDNDWTWARAIANLSSMYQIHLAIACAGAPVAYQLLHPLFGHTVLSARFRRGQNLHATKKLNDQSSYFSLRSKSPGPTLQAPRSWRDSTTLHALKRKRTHIVDEIRTDSLKKAGKRKITPPALDLEHRPSTNRKSMDGSQCEITVVYTPSRPQTHNPEMQSPTIPSDFWLPHNRLSNMSWITGGSKRSRWSSIMSSAGSLASTQRPQSTKSRNAISPLSPNSPYSPGLSTIDLDHLGELPTIKTLPQRPEIRIIKIPCRMCGKVHPPNYRHSGAEIETNLSRFALLRHGMTPNRATFYDDRDEEDDLEPSKSRAR